MGRNHLTLFAALFDVFILLCHVVLVGRKITRPIMRVCVW
jgi:hypothetical protein